LLKIDEILHHRSGTSCIVDPVHPPFLIDAESFRTHLEETLASLQ